MFGSAEFLIYFGIPTLFAGAFGVEWPVVCGIWATAILSHVSLFQRIAFIARHYGRKARDARPASAPGADDATPGAGEHRDGASARAAATPEG